VRMGRLPLDSQAARLPRSKEEAMRIRATAVLVTGFLTLAPPISRAALSSYTQNFESMVPSNSAALSSDGWVVYGNVFDPTHTNYLYGYGPFPAPNGGTAFSAVVAGEGGPLQGTQQLSVYSDYNNTGAHGAGQQVESNVYHEQTIVAGDVGGIWTFQFDAKLGNLAAPSTAIAFLKTLNPAAGYALTNFLTVDMTAIPTTWNTYTILISIGADLEGQIIQFGFANTASNFVSSGVFYDNVVWSQTGTVGVDRPGQRAFDLRPATPNPFRSSVRMDFDMALDGHAELSVYDLAGRRVTTLFDGIATAGPHTLVWDGRRADGRTAPNGVYQYTLRTAAGRRTRSLVLHR
jgi:hypothetical protein